MKKTIVRTEGLKKYYPVGGTVVKALDGVDLEIGAGICFCDRKIRQRQKHPAAHAGRPRCTDGRPCNRRWRRSFYDER